MKANGGVSRRQRLAEARVRSRNGRVAPGTEIMTVETGMF
jgi:hypothetical protein